MSIVDNVKSFVELKRQFITFHSSTRYENIIDVDNKKDVPANKNTRIKFARYKAEIHNSVVEHEAPDTGCLLEPIQ